jgi:hypothetical protein
VVISVFTDKSGYFSHFRFLSVIFFSTQNWYNYSTNQKSIEIQSSAEQTKYIFSNNITVVEFTISHHASKKNVSHVYSYLKYEFLLIHNAPEAAKNLTSENVMFITLHENIIFLNFWR